MVSRRLGAFLLTSVIGISACGSSAATTAPAAPAATTAPAATAAPTATTAHTVTIALVPGGTGDNFWTTMNCGVYAAAKAAGATVTTNIPINATAIEQKPIIDAVTAQKPDILLVSATDSTVMQAPIQAAANAGIKVVFVNSATDDPSFAVTSVTTDDVAGGALAFAAIKKLKPAGGKVLVMGSMPGSQNTDNRDKGFEAAIKADPAYTYLGIQYSKNTAILATQLVAAALQKDPDMVAIFAAGSITAQGSAAGLKQGGKQGQVALVGFDAGPGQIAEIKDGSVQALIAQSPFLIGQKGVQAGLGALAGKPVDKIIQTPVTVITKDNVDTAEGKAAAYQASC